MAIAGQSPSAGAQPTARARRRASAARGTKGATSAVRPAAKAGSASPRGDGLGRERLCIAGVTGRDARIAPAAPCRSGKGKARRIEGSQPVGQALAVVRQHRRGRDARARRGRPSSKNLVADELAQHREGIGQRATSETITLLR